MTQNQSSWKKWNRLTLVNSKAIEIFTAKFKMNEFTTITLNRGRDETSTAECQQEEQLF